MKESTVTVRPIEFPEQLSSGPAKYGYSITCQSKDVAIQCVAYGDMRQVDLLGWNLRATAAHDLSDMIEMLVCARHFLNTGGNPADAHPLVSFGIGRVANWLGALIKHHLGEGHLYYIPYTTNAPFLARIPDLAKRVSEDAARALVDALATEVSDIRDRNRIEIAERSEKASKG